MKIVNLNIDPDGTVKFIHDDELAALIRSLDPYEMQIRRASHVEPIPDGKGWTADLSPVGGGFYGPFETRAYALQFEMEWLKANRGL